MATTKEDIEKWFKEGKKQKATHLIVVCDTFSYEDYPVYVSIEENVYKKYGGYNNKSMQRVMEVYNLSQKMKKQLNKNRTLNF